MIRLNKDTHKFWSEKEAMFAELFKYKPKNRPSYNQELLSIVKEFEDSQKDKETYVITTNNSICHKFLANLRFEPKFKQIGELRIILDDTFDPSLNMFLYSLSFKPFGFFGKLVITTKDK